jgi:hypothetical protein
MLRGSQSYCIYLNAGSIIYKGRLDIPRLLWDSEVSQSPTLVSIQSQIGLRLYPLYLPNFILDFHDRMDVRELSDVK